MSDWLYTCSECGGEDGEHTTDNCVNKSYDAYGDDEPRDLYDLLVSGRA